jgi:anti-sigma factor RsiW
MNHQPFETWILEESKLSSTEKHELLEHMEKCPKCANLEKNWRMARQYVKTMPAMDAPAGFSNRFQASLAHRRKLQEQRQTRILLISLISSAVAILVTLALFFLPHTSFTSLLINFLGSLLQLINAISQFWLLLTSFIKSAPPSFLITMMLVVSMLISIISVLWVFSFLRITMKGIKVTHEN